MTAPRVPNLAIDEELKRKLLFSLLAVLIYRVGAHIAAPGVYVPALAAFIQNSAAAGFFGLYDALGGGLSRATVFALGIMPYISASIIFQLAGGLVPTVSKMQKEEEGRKKLTQWTRYMAIFIALSQAYTFTLFTESIPGAIPSPGLSSRLIMVTTLTAGAVFVMWLGEQITERGIGNGMSILITVSILERLWPGLIQTIIIVPGTIAQFSKIPSLMEISNLFNPGSWVYNLVFAAMIVLFSYFYTSIIFNAVDLSENLKKQGAFIPGVRPGSATADYIDQVLARVTLPGALFLAFIAVMPIIVSQKVGFQSQFGGTSILIVVGVLLDTISQVEQHRTLRKYDSFMKTGRVKFRGRQRFI